MASKAKTAKKIKVAIYVSGGVVQDTKANQEGVEVTVFDVDNLKADGLMSWAIDERWAKILDETHWDTI
jgi:hypothetical protein